MTLGLLGCGGDDDDGGSTVGGDSSTKPKTETSLAGPVTGPVGATLKTADNYSSNGRAVTERLAITVLEVNPEVDPPQYLEPAAGNRYVGVRIKVTQNGPTSTDLVADQFEILDTEDQSYGTAQYSGLAQPDIMGQAGSIALDAGETRSGFLTFEVPRTANLSEFAFRDAGFGPEPDTARWTIR